MEKRGQTLIVAYNGVDGACSAALALTACPKATVVTTSARRIANTLSAHAGYAKVHVCGVGVQGPWDELEVVLRKLKKAGARVTWHCGRGYLDDKREALAGLCETAFVTVGTNTAAVARYFGLTDNPNAKRLIALARHDVHVQEESGGTRPSAEDVAWLDYIQAAMAEYFKFQDIAPYQDCIRALTSGERPAQAGALIARFRGTGYKHLLHGDSASMRHLKERIQRCADARRPVVITGESGVGKELVANLLYERSARSMGPLIAVNCSIYAGNIALANSDLFGHKKGAFTGATQDRKGKFVQADGGVLFLDELGELPLEVQAKLLRVVEDGKVTPEGADHHESEVDVLIIAATHRNLPEMVARGTFREDLYHRLATLRIQVSPLRERPEDIAIIAKQRLEGLALEGHTRTLTRNEMEMLQAYAWPGNVRQLVKLLERAVLLGMSIEEALAEERAFGDVAGKSAADEMVLPASKEDVLPMSDVQRRYARRVWELHGGNFNAAAAALDVAVNTLRYNYLKSEN